MRNTSILLLLLSFISYISCQHTTSLKFSGGVQPTGEPVFCPQVVCPTDNLQEPSCPSQCPNSCKIVPDKCCPLKKIAVCDNDNSGSSSPAISSSTGTATPTGTTIVTGTPSGSSTPSQSSVSGSQSSAGNTPSTAPNSAVNMKPSVCLSVLLFVFVYLLV